MKIGVLADTHGVLRESVIVKLRECDVILHAGDIGGHMLLGVLQSIAPTVAVCGNNDEQIGGATLPEQVIGTLGPIRYLMVHDQKDIPKEVEGIDLMVYGHSHQYVLKQGDSCTWLNPGSCGRRRFKLPLTMAIIHTEGKVWWVEKITFDT